MGGQRVSREEALRIAKGEALDLLFYDKTRILVNEQQIVAYEYYAVHSGPTIYAVLKIYTNGGWVVTRKKPVFLCEEEDCEEVDSGDVREWIEGGGGCD